MYAVVRFTNEPDSVSEVPVAWLINDNKKCWWPANAKNINLCIKKAIQPDANTWEQHDIILETIGVSLDTARKKAELVDYTSSEEQGRGMRKGKSIVFDSESSDYSEPKDRRKAANIPPPPSLPLTAFTNSRQYEDVINNEYSDKSLAQSIDITSLPIIFQDSTHTAEISATSSPIPGSLATRVHDVDIVELKDCYAKMARSLKLINLNLTAINSRLENIEKSNRNAGIVEEENVITTEFLPLKSTEAVIVFEEQLNSNKELLALFRNYIKTIGGNSPKDAIYRILNRTFTNECGMFCSWMGYRNNFRVSKLNIIKYIKDEVCNTYSFLKENEFEQIGGEWFRFSKQRHARQQKSK